MNRSYELEPIEGGGWKLRLLEDGEEVGGGKGGEDDFNDLYQAAEEFAGIDQSGMRP